jgi:23S rRNA U2552 (ribose-2'-O)-methylase RlmE/FtsJ
MSLAPEKPPWARIQWYPNPCRFLTVIDISGCPQPGDWQEDRHDEIETLKESIQPYDRSELWDLAKRITNPYELISTHSSRLSLPKSICCIHPLSRSFFKMIEMLTHLDFFERHKDIKLRSLHVCEGPGGFIEAFHYCADYKKRMIQASYAMTLKSTHAMIPGWRRATQYLQKHPNIQLLYGPTRTGNIYEPCNQDECVKAAGTQGVPLVTADGGFDFSEDFAAQEESILRLLVCSSLILLRAVAEKGDIVIKLFDCNSPVTRDLVTLLASCFQHWTLYKPVTSRPCNSEWYFIGRSAFRNRQPVVDVLTRVRDGLAQEPPVKYARLLGSSPLEEQLKQMQAARVEKQMEALKEVLSFCKNKDTVSHSALWERQKTLCVNWCNSFRMPRYT